LFIFSGIGGYKSVGDFIVMKFWLVTKGDMGNYAQLFFPLFVGAFSLEFYFRIERGRFSFSNGTALLVCLKSDSVTLKF
jgi:hypothetical protein